MTTSFDKTRPHPTVATKGILSSDSQMSHGQFQLGMESIGTHLNFPWINVTAPLARATGLSSFDMPFLLPSSHDGSSSLGSLSVLPSPCSTGSSFTASLTGHSPTPSTPAFDRTSKSQQGHYITNYVGNGMAPTNLQPDVLPADDVLSNSGGAILTEGFSQSQRDHLLPVDTMWLSSEGRLLGSIDYPRPESNAVNQYDKVQGWGVTATSRVPSPQRSVCWHASPVEHHLGFRDVRSEFYAGRQSDSATHLIGPMLNPGLSTFQGAFNDALLREPMMSTAALLPPASAFENHRCFGDGAGPSYVNNGIRVEERAIGMDVLKIEVASTKMKQKSASRRKMEANYMCPLPGCDDTFTKKHNLNSENYNSHRMLRTHC